MNAGIRGISGSGEDWMNRVYDKDLPFPGKVRRSKAQILRYVLFRTWEMRIDDDAVDKTFNEYYNFKIDFYIEEQLNELRKW